MPGKVRKYLPRQRDIIIFWIKCKSENIQLCVVDHTQSDNIFC